MNKARELHVFLRGGLGNQLFQYATALSLSLEFDRTLFIRTDTLPSSFDTVGGISRWPCQVSRFNHSGTIVSKSHQPRGGTNAVGKVMQTLRMIGDIAPKQIQNMGILASESPSQELVNPRKIWLVNAYAASREHALRNRERLRSEISNLKEESREYRNLRAELLQSETIMVHVRKGDFENLAHLYGSLPPSYFEDAINQLRLNLGPGTRTWILTDDTESISEEVLEAVGAERIIGPAALPDALENLNLLRQGAGIVASNSTFSWWGAFLAADDAKIIAPVPRGAAVRNFNSSLDPDKNWAFLDA